MTHGYPTAAAFVPDTGDLAVLAHAAVGCQGCDLYTRATQTVFGEGAVDADVVLVGEQPADVEDRQGKPFVGPAGRLLAAALGDAGIPRDRAYVTNAVKHFRWKPIRATWLPPRRRSGLSAKPPTAATRATPGTRRSAGRTHLSDGNYCIMARIDTSGIN